MIREDKQNRTIEEDNINPDGSSNKKNFKFKNKSGKSKNVKERNQNKSPRIKTNDPAYYTLNPELARNAANLSFGNPAGATLTLGNLPGVGGSAVPVKTTLKTNVPGICVLTMLPTISNEKVNTDPVNVASKSIYSWVRHANSGHANYDAPDLLIYLLAMREPYSFIGMMTRLFGLLSTYNVANRYIPKYVVQALGFDFDDLLMHIADLRYYINSFAKRVNALSVPQSLPLYHKAFNMYTKIYADGKLNKEQLYAYNPGGFYVFSGTQYKTGSALIFKSLADLKVSEGNYLTYDDLVAIGEAILEPLLSDEDIGIMSGDIRKAFGTNVYILGQIPDYIQFEFTHDSFEVQIMHNTRPYRVAFGTGRSSVAAETERPDIIQLSNGFLMQSIKSSLGVHQWTTLEKDTYLFDIDSESPTVEDIIEASLYIADPIVKNDFTAFESEYWVTIREQTLPNVVIGATSDYIAVGYDVFYLDVDNGNLTGRSFLGAKNENNSSEMSVLDAFTWHPFVVMVNPSTQALTYVYGTKHNYTILDVETLKNIHSAVWLSLLAIPAVEHIKGQ